MTDKTQYALVRPSTGQLLAKSNDYERMEELKERYEKRDWITEIVLYTNDLDEPKEPPREVAFCRAFYSWCLICGGPPGKCWYDEPEMAEEGV